jgi:hypothetical protein
MRRWIVVLAAAAAAGGAGAQVLGKDEYRAHVQRIEAEHDAARERCKPLEGNERDLCKVRAQGTLHVAKAQLHAQYKPGPASQEKLAMARAEAAHALAREQCDDLKGHARDVCRKDAKAQFAAARAQAKSVRSALASGEDSMETQRRREEVRVEQSSALYAAGKERCEALAGTARELCIADLRKRFGKL